MNHEGHKSRLRQKALLDIATLQEHEVLELILNYSIVRKNTNQIAHDLINRFGSLANVMNANISQLLQVEGLGEVSATLLVLLPKIFGIYNKSICAKYSKIETPLVAFDYFKTLTKSLNHEECFALCLDKHDKIITNITLGVGDIDSIDITPQKALKEILKINPAKIYLCHNHVIDNSYPSNADIAFTNAFMQCLKPWNITFLDHIIVSKSSIFSFKNAGLI